MNTAINTLLRDAFDAWWLYMIDTSPSVVPEFVAIGTGIVAASLAYLIAWPFLGSVRR